MEVGVARLDLHLGRARHAGVALLLPFADPEVPRGRFGAVHPRDELRLAKGLLAPGAGDDVSGRLPLFEEVHGDLREERGRSPLQQQDFVGTGHAEQLPDECDRLVVYRLVLLPAVAVLHHRHAASGEVEKLVAGALQRGKGKGGGSGVEIDRPFHGGPPTGRN